MTAFRARWTEHALHALDLTAVRMIGARPLPQYPHLHDLVERAERVRPEAREVANTVQASIDALTMTVGRGRATWVDDPGCPSAGRGQPA